MGKQLKRSNQGFDSPLPGILGTNPLITGLTGLFRIVVSVRNLAFDTIHSLSYQAGRPVISIGGIRAGGTGKTPLAQLLGQFLCRKGYEVAFLSRGYGRMSKKPILVAPDGQADWENVGDEPALLHSNVRSWLGVGANRVESARKLASRIPPNTVFILDDGFQHRKIKRDLDIVCLNEHTFREKMIPAGFLREPLNSLKRAKLFILTGSEEEVSKLRDIKGALENRFSGSHCSILLQKPECWIQAQSGKVCDKPPFQTPWIICAIARPQRFIRLVESEGMKPAGIKCFNDHHIFQSDDLTTMQDIYSKGVVTTEKDYMRLRSLDVAQTPALWYLKLKLQFADSESEMKFESAINSTLQFDAEVF
ncbi:MAG: tetraacyldisaccharide 4'-kinase [Chitinispirillaceae bacterium]